MKFKLGRLVTTKGIYAVMFKSGEFRKHVVDSLALHMRGDWGDLLLAGQVTNNKALKSGGRLMSAYKYKYAGGERPAWTIWIITEADRAMTTVLFPRDYRGAKMKANKGRV